MSRVSPAASPIGRRRLMRPHQSLQEVALRTYLSSWRKDLEASAHPCRSAVRCDPSSWDLKSCQTDRGAAAHSCCFSVVMGGRQAESSATCEHEAFSPALKLLVLTRRHAWGVRWLFQTRMVDGMDTIIGVLVEGGCEMVTVGVPRAESEAGG